MEPIVGIDLGTSTTCLAVVVKGKPKVVPDSRGNRVTPSYIHVMEDGRILVGMQAKAEVISDPYSTIWATKRLIGRRYDDPHIQEAKKHFGYEILPGSNGGVLVRGRDKEFSPTEVGAIILKYMTRLGRKALGFEIKKAVITVPAYFMDPQRKATKAAGAMIGLDVVRLINEPTAAALAYGYDLDTEQTIAVFDLGGGTFDLSLLHIGHGVFEVIASDGDSYLGGEDFDNRLVDFLISDFQKKYGINIYNDKMAHQRVKDAAERTKIALSSRTEVEINLPAMCPDLNRWAGIETVITRQQYEDLVADLADRPIQIFARLLAEQKFTPGDLDNVIMVGGMTRMPLIQRKVAAFFGRTPDTSVNPDEAVAIGAAIHAASLAGEKLLHKKVRPMPPRPEIHPPSPAPDDLTAPAMPPIEPAGATAPLSAMEPNLPVDKEAPLPVDKEAPLPPQVEIPPPLAPPAWEKDKSLPLDPQQSSAQQETPPAIGKEWEEEPLEMPAEEEFEAEAPRPVPVSPPGLDDFFQSAEEAELPREKLAGEKEKEQIPPPLSSPLNRERDEEPLYDSGLRPISPNQGERERASLLAATAAPTALVKEYDSEDAEERELEPEGDEAGAVNPEWEAPSELVQHYEPESAETAPAFGEPATPEEEMPVAAGPIIREARENTAEESTAPDSAASSPAPPTETSSRRPPEEKEEFREAPILLDVLSHTVGIAHLGGHFVPLIRRFSKLPARASQVFTTCTDNQQRLRISVLQGESKYVKDNTLLGEFVLEGIENNKRGIPQIDVTFDIDPSGIFMVSARDKRTGALKEIRVENWTAAHPATKESERGKPL